MAENNAPVQDLQEIPNANHSEDQSSSINPSEQPENVASSVQTDTDKKIKSSAKKTPDYNPVYTQEQLDLFAKTDLLFEDEVNRLGKELPDYITPFNGGKNMIVDVTKCVQDGKVTIFGCKLNRTHGGDQTKTGASIMTYGAQCPILVVPKAVADAFGMPMVHFSNDPDQTSKPSENDLMAIDGHGRLNFLFSIEKEKWPQIFAILPSPDHLGHYNIVKFFSEINLNLAAWKSENYVQKRILEDGVKSHPGWLFIQKLLQSGYKYQAACELATLKTDRVKASEVNSGNAKDIFKYHDVAIKVFETLVKKFGEDSDTLKTKCFPLEVSRLWNLIVDAKGKDDGQTLMLKFIENISEATSTSILQAKGVKGGLTKDQHRVNLLDDAFKAFVALEGLNIKLN